MQALRLTVVRRSSSMMPILSGVARQAQHVLDAAEQLARRTPPRRARASWASRCRPSRRGCCGAAVPLRSCRAISAGDQRVEHASRDLVAVERHRVGGHVVADIADQHQAAAGQGERRRRPGAV